MNSIEGRGEALVSISKRVLPRILDGCGWVVGFIECVGGPVRVERKGRLGLLEETFSAGPNFVVDVVDEEGVEMMLLLELLREFIIVVVLVQKDTVHLIIFDFDFYHR